MSPPLIGVSTSEVRFPQDVDQTEHAEPPRRELAVGVTYAEAVEQAGAMPVVLAPVAVEMIDPGPTRCGCPPARRRRRCATRS